MRTKREENVNGTIQQVVVKHFGVKNFNNPVVHLV